MSEIDWDALEGADDSGGGGRYGELPGPETYDFFVHDTEAGKSKAGNPMITATLQVESGPYEGQWVDNYITFTEAASGIVKANLKALGVYEEAKAAGADINKVAKMIIGKRCRAKIINVPGDDRVFNNVKGALKEPEDGKQPETKAAATANDPF